MKKYKFRRRPFYQLVMEGELKGAKFKKILPFGRIELCVIRAIKILNDGGVDDGFGAIKIFNDGSAVYEGHKIASLSVERCVYEKIGGRVFVVSAMSVEEMLRTVGPSCLPATRSQTNKINQWGALEPTINLNGRKIAASKLLSRIARRAEDALDARVATWSPPAPIDKERS